MPNVHFVDGLDTDGRAQVELLLDAVATSTGRPALSDHLLADLRSGGDVTAALATDDTGELVAYGQVSLTGEGATLEIAGATVPEIVQWATAQPGARPLSWWVTDPDDADHAAATAAGMHVDRTLHQMRRPLPLDVHATVETRSFLPGHDEGAWLTVNNRAFAGHAEQSGWTLATLEQRERQPWFDPDGFRLHEREGRLAAFCWTKVHDPGTAAAAGEIYVIAVDPDFHGLGLGRELTLAGLDHLSDAGLREALLYVAAENAAAVGLYESLGFRISYTRTAFAVGMMDQT